MIRKFLADEEDSDEDRVIFDDDVRTVSSEAVHRGTISTSNSSMKDKGNHRPLFQYRKFKEVRCLGCSTASFVD